jgi:hypothetical protein
MSFAGGRDSEGGSVISRDAGVRPGVVLCFSLKKLVGLPLGNSLLSVDCHPVSAGEPGA